MNLNLKTILNIKNISFINLMIIIILHCIWCSYYYKQKKILIDQFNTFKSISKIPYPSDAVIDYNNLNSPLYSHTVNMPLNDPISCSNFCGPNATCLKTGEQCSADIDCYGCNPGPKLQSNCIQNNHIKPFYDVPIFGKNASIVNENDKTKMTKNEIDNITNDNVIKPSFGINLWSNSFNKGIELYNKKQKSANKYNQGITNNYLSKANPIIESSILSKRNYYENKLNYKPNYKLSKSITGEFYETTAPAYNTIYDF